MPKTFFRDHTVKLALHRAMKIVLWILAGLLCVILLAVVALQFPGVQRFIVQKALSSIAEKTQTRIEVGSINVAFTNSAVLQNIFVESRQRDTLLFIRTLAADVNLLGLFSHEITLKNVRVDSLTAHITRTLPDSSFNFDFILDALGADSTAEVNPEPSSGAGWAVRLGGLSLNGMVLTYDDAVSGLNLEAHLGVLEASIDKFDLEAMQFHIDEVSLKNTRASVLQTKGPTPDEPLPGDAQAVTVDFRVGTISLADLHLSYENTVANERYVVDLGSSTLVSDTFDLPSHQLALKSFTLANTSLVVVQPGKSGAETETSAAASVPWVLSLDRLSLSDNSITYDVHGAVRARGFDPNHLRLEGLTVQADNLYYSESRIAADIRQASLREGSGLEVRELSGGFTLDSLHAELTNFTVATTASRVHQNILLSYSSLSALKDLSGTVQVKATIDESHLAVSDLLFFQPSLPIKNKTGATIRFSSKLSGRIQDLQVEELRVATGDSTAMDLTGSVRGLPGVETAHYDVNLRRFTSGRNDIQELVADTLLPKDIVLPASMSLRGQFKGTPRDFSASSVLATSIGSVKGTATLNSGQRDDATASRWKTEITVEELDIGSLLNDPETFGPVSLQASASGTGLSKDDMVAQLKVEVDKAVLYGYAYRRLTLNGTASPNMFEGNAAIQDSNIVFTFNGTVNTGEENPTYQFTFDLKGADLQRLHFTSDDIRVSGVITSDLTGQTIDGMNGTIRARNVVIIKNRRHYLIDSLVVASVNTENETHIRFESPLLAATFDGSIALGELPGAMKAHFNRYFTLHDTPIAKASGAQAFSFQIVLRDPRMLTEVFFPQLERLTAGVIEGTYGSEEMILNVNIDIPTLAYGGLDIDSLGITVTSNPQRLQAAVRMGSMGNEMLHLSNVQLSASVEDDSIEVSLQSLESNGGTTMLLAGICTSVPDGYQFRFLPDGIVFQNTPWHVPADHTILFGSNQFVVHHVELRDSLQSLLLNSTDSTTRQPPLNIEFVNFKLATVSLVVERDSGLVRGVLNGNVALENLDKQMAFTSDLNIQDFTFARSLVGDINVRANNQTEGVYELTMELTGNDNDIAMQGHYRSKVGGSELDLDLDFNTMNLATVEPFTFGSVERLSGSMTGELHMSGTFTKPSITGNLQFTNTALNPTMLGSYVRIEDGRITFDGQGIHFQSFELSDTLGHKASLRGNLFTEDFLDFRYDLRIHTEDFLLLNKPSSRDALYYGTVFLDSDIVIGGDQARPVIRMQAQLDKGTDLAVVLPESETSLQQRRGIVRFVEVESKSNPIMSRSKPRTGGARDTTREKLSAIDLTANVEVNKESRLRILIDPIAGDSLVIRGEATFSVGVDPSGKLSVTGRYEIMDGSYQLSFGDFIRRQFAIEKGSSITWFGSVTEANVDITALYTAKTSALDLVQDQLVGLSPEERNKYKQELRIQVFLMMDGRLLQPNIRFRLDLPPDQRGALGGSIYAKLNELNGQESELNKQVFALLVLGRFISSNPLASASDGGLSGFARSSVSQILTAQLNRLSEQFITGMSLNVGAESFQDYSSGTAEGRTQLQLSLTKQLFDERITVQVGGNVDLEGRRSQQNSLNNFAGDIKVAYKMTEDGRWQLQVFRQNTHGGAIEGDLVETGLGIIFTIDYDKLFGFSLKPLSGNGDDK
jgi:hypothetical protein